MTPLVWVPAGYSNLTAINALYELIDEIPADGQEIAYADVLKGGDTIAATVQLRFEGALTPQLTRSEPSLVDASVELPAVQKLSPVGPVTIRYFQTYLDKDFGGPANVADVWAEVPSLPQLSFGGAAAGSDKAGGFLQPNLEIAGLSRIKGTVGDVANIAKGTFDPSQFFGSAFPRLFGLVPLEELLDGVGLDDAPDVVSEALERIEGFLADLERAKRAVEDAVAEAQRLKDRAPVQSRRAPTAGAGRLRRRPGPRERRQGRRRRHPDDALAATWEDRSPGRGRARQPAGRAPRCDRRDREGRAEAAAAHPRAAARARTDPPPGRGRRRSDRRRSSAS